MQVFEVSLLVRGQKASVSYQARARFGASKLHVKLLIQPGDGVQRLVKGKKARMWSNSGPAHRARSGGSSRKGNLEVLSNTSKMQLILISAAALSVSLVCLAQSVPAPGSNDARTVAEFQKRAKQYLDWRNNIGKTPSPGDSPEKIIAARRELANKVRVGRAGAKQGEIFRPDAADYFRRQIAATLNSRHGERVRSSLRHSEPTEMELQINQSYPEKVALQSTPPSLLLNLPELPKGLEYRILGRELVLRDSDANIVVDYVANALPGKSK